MFEIGFDNDKYLSLQSQHIKERIGKFGGKLYLEFGGKLFDDYHASPDDFQLAEFLLEKGFVDMIVERKRMRSVLSHVMKLHGYEKEVL